MDSPTHPYVATGLQQHKFGISMDRIDEIIDLLGQSHPVQLVGLGCHIGSQILEIQPFLDAFLELKAAAARSRQKVCPSSIWTWEEELEFPTRTRLRPI